LLLNLNAPLRIGKCTPRTTCQRWPESLFQTPSPLLFENFWIQVRVRQFFKFENPTPVQTPATVIVPTIIYPCFYLRNDPIDSCYCRNWKVTLGPVFHKFLTPGPGPKEKHRILPESNPALLIRCHLWYMYHRLGTSALAQSVIKGSRATIVPVREWKGQVVLSGTPRQFLVEF